MAPAPGRVVLEISGMSCAACVARIERGLGRVPGVRRAAVNLSAGSAVVEYDEAVVSPAALAEKVASLGYQGRVRDGKGSGPDPSLAEERRLKTGFVGSLSVFLLAMVLGAPLMGHDAGGVLGGLAMPLHGVLHRTVPVLWDIPPAVLRWILLLSHLPVLLVWGRQILVSAWKAALHRTADMNTLVACGALSAFALSVPSVVASGWLSRHDLPAPVWFESVSGVVGFVLFGKWLEARAKKRSRGALEELARLLPDRARLVGEGQAPDRLVDPALLVPRDVVRVLPGERVPADGRVTKGVGALDESHLTGEPLAREVGPGDLVRAGSVAGNTPLEIAVEQAGADTSLARIGRLVEEAQATKPPLQRTADRIAEWFAPAVLILSAITLAAWLALLPHEPLLALSYAVAVLVAACPCALGLAIPSALTVAVGRAARMGLLVREAATLEALGRVTTVVLDKTGTLTEGKPRLLRTAPAPGVQENELVRLASGAETGSSHPLAEAVLETAKSRDLVVPPSQEASTVPGQGAQAVVEGHRLRAGRLEWCLDAPSTVSVSRNVAQAGETPVHVSSDGAWIGTLLFGDPLRGDAISTVAALHRRNLAVHILSGDGPEAVEAVAKAVGADGWTARATPQAKADRIAKLRADGAVVAMVGDGINDAPALARADASLAMGGGTAVAFESAGAVVDKLDRLPAALDLGKATVRTVRGNLAWAFGYNALLLPVAAGVLYPWTGIRLSPTLAGAAMSLSSVSVVAHSLRLLGFSPKPVPKGPTTPLRSGSSGSPSKGLRPAA